MSGRCLDRFGFRWRWCTLMPPLRRPYGDPEPTICYHQSRSTAGWVIHSERAYWRARQFGLVPPLSRRRGRRNDARSAVLTGRDLYPKGHHPSQARRADRGRAAAGRAGAAGRGSAADGQRARGFYADPSLPPAMAPNELGVVARKSRPTRGTFRATTKGRYKVRQGAPTASSGTVFGSPP